MADRINPWKKEAAPPPNRDFTGMWPTYGEPALFDWAGVDGAVLRAFFQVAASSGKTIGIGPAIGGRGVTVTLYMGLKQNPKRHALTPDELHDLMLPLIDKWGSGSEDVVEVMRAALRHTGSPAAD